MPTEFRHLHLHTEYSTLDGLGRIEQYVARLKALGMPGAAITDHGVLHGAIPWVKACREAGLRGVVGVEAYYSPGGAAKRNNDHCHLTLLAESEVGYRNLLWLTTEANLSGFYHKPRLDRAMLADHAEGIIALTACISGEVPAHIIGGREDVAERALGQMLDIFGRRSVYVELMDHGINEEHVANSGLIRLAAANGVPLVATNDVHYVEEGDYTLQDTLICIQTGSHRTMAGRMTATQQLYLKSGDEMARLFPSHPEAIRNTVEIFERCAWTPTIGGKTFMPEFKLPPGKTEAGYLRELAERGCAERYAGSRAPWRERLDTELDVIHRMGFDSYFLVVWDIVNAAREKGILTGPGRGSAAGSIVAYGLGITSIDPLAHGLLFERFLNLGRHEMPDIDLDFESERRGEVIAHINNRYGSERVAQLATYPEMKAKQAWNDVARVNRIPPPIAKVVSGLIGDNGKLARVFEDEAIKKVIADYAPREVEKVNQLTGEKEVVVEGFPIEETLKEAQRLEGAIRSNGRHAAGVVIGDRPLVELVAMSRGENEGERVAQVDLNLAGEMGLLKMDILGLTALTTIKHACRLIKEFEGVDIDPERIPLDDPATYEIFRNGDLLGIFQLEGGLCIRMAHEMQPMNFEDITALISLSRPGPMDLAPDFFRRRLDPSLVDYPHPALAGVLADTSGIMVYQEQVMKVAQILAQYSLTDADKLRKAMGKKIPEMMAAERAKFVKGCVENDRLTPRLTEDRANEIFDLINTFAGYGFNLSHAAAYATMSVRGAYIKRHHPAAFVAGLLTSEGGKLDRQAILISDARRRGVKILPPDINRSKGHFNLERLPSGELAVRFGLIGIKGVSKAVVGPLVESVARHPVRTANDLHLVLSHPGVTRAGLQKVIEAGACDALGGRAAVVELLNNSGAVAAARRMQGGQMPLFGNGLALDIPLPKVETTRADILRQEREAMGDYMSDHPLRGVDLSRMNSIQGILEGDLEERSSVEVAALINRVREFPTKRGQAGSLVLVDLDHEIEVVFWSDRWGGLRQQLLGATGMPVVLAGATSYRNGQWQIIGDKIIHLGVEALQEGAAETPVAKADPIAPTGLHLRFPVRRLPVDEVGVMRRARDLISHSPGTTPVHLYVGRGPHGTVLRSPDGVAITPVICRRLEEMLDDQGVVVWGVPAGR